MKTISSKERIIVVVAGLCILSLSLYFYQITRIKQGVLETGNEAKVKVIKLSYTTGGKTVYVEFNDKEYNAGYAFGVYNDVAIGDTISILYKPGIDYVVLKEKKTFLSTIIFEYIIIGLGGFFVVVGLFYKERTSKSNKSKVDGTIFSKNDGIEPEEFKKQIVQEYGKDRHKVNRIIEELLITKDDRVESILDALFENHCFSDHEFITLLRDLMQLYFKNQEQIYLDVIKVFITSEQVENIENQITVKNLIESSSGFSHKIQNELLSLLKE